MESAQILRLQERFRAIPIEVRKAVEPALEKSAEELASRMRSLAPRDSGDLIDSIAITTAGTATPPYSQPGGSMVVAENAVVITVGNSDVRYPHLVEYGTAKAHAQPFFWVSVRLLKKRIQSRIKRSISKAVKQEWGK
jgi:HK97 gp10 family phage protein